MWAIIIGTASTDFCCSNLLLHLSSKQQAGVCVNASCLFLQDSRVHSCFNSLNFFLQMITNLEQLSRQTPAAGHKHSSAVTQPVPPTAGSAHGLSSEKWQRTSWGQHGCAPWGTAGGPECSITPRFLVLFASYCSLALGKANLHQLLLPGVCMLVFHYLPLRERETGSEICRRTGCIYLLELPR